MNQFIDIQITNMLAMLTTFRRSCQMAAIQDDGRVSRDEEKVLKALEKATATYEKELNRLRH